MSDKSMQFSKSQSGARPGFDHIRYGDVVSRVGADKSNGNAGGEVAGSKFSTGPLVKDSLANKS
jgi:hypothetical protein